MSLSRRGLGWGVPVPWDPEQVFYVWWDALLNYYTALSFARPGEDLTDRFWPASLHLIGKDILKFHTVYWPALLMAADLPLPEHVFVHGFLLMDGEKMSKSLGNVLDPFEVIDRFGSDALRFYLLRDVSFGQDGSVSPAAFEQRYESELANEYGNLASRTLAMVVRYRDGVAARRAARPGARRRLRRAVRHGRRAARPRRGDAGARGDLAARAAAEPLRRGARAVEARQGRGERGGARRRARERSSRACAC